MKNRIASDLIKEIEREGLKIEKIGREAWQLARTRNEAFSDLLPSEEENVTSKNRSQHPSISGRGLFVVARICECLGP